MSNIHKINDFVLEIATVNGSGSQSANNIIMKTIFRMGIPVGGKNLFPSNIAGLPTWFTIRVNELGFTARREEADIFIAMNPQTIKEDLKKVRAQGWIFINDEIKLDPQTIESYSKNINLAFVPFKELVQKATESIKLKKLLVNMIYVGLLAELLGLDSKILAETISDQFKGKTTAIESNLKAMQIGQSYAVESLQYLRENNKFNLYLKSLSANLNKILIDGNTSAALGFIFGGCTFASWYPITPSSSVLENYMNFSDQFRLDENKKSTGAIIQAEDELAAICMVMGAGWAGARAMTSTSGPGLSLMAEAAGMFYYGEIPGVIWDVQRVGPSTGMPTRTAQGDILFAHTLSHGDTKHIVLLPANMEECFEFAQTSLDLAERFQTLVISLSDLDLGMNFWISNEFSYPTKPFDRGKILTATELDKIKDYGRYKDVDGDGIPYRTLPGTHHDAAAYFTRGSGHDEKALYTENSEAYSVVLNRLNKKFETAKNYVPKPKIQLAKSSNGQVTSKLGIIAFGSTDLPMQEALHELDIKNLNFNYLRLRAIPFTEEVDQFVKNNEKIFVVEQNRDSQMMSLLKINYPEFAARFVSITHFDGLPITAKNIYSPIVQNLMEKN